MLCVGFLEAEKRQHFSFSHFYHLEPFSFKMLHFSAVTSVLLQRRLCKFFGAGSGRASSGFAIKVK